MRYHFKKNSFIVCEELNIRGKVVFKTVATDWVGTLEPIVVIVSVHSLFHREIDGELKMGAMMDTLRESVQGNVTVLIADLAHLQAQQLKGVSERDLIESAHHLAHRYKEFFRGCELAFWHQMMMGDAAYRAVEQIRRLAWSDSLFRQHLLSDALLTYQQIGETGYLSQEVFVAMTQDDLIQQCASLILLSRQGYRYQFYPGLPYASVTYVYERFELKTEWVPVFIAIEKKRQIYKGTTNGLHLKHRTAEAQG